MGLFALVAFCFLTETETLSAGPTPDARRILASELNNFTGVDNFFLGSTASYPYVQSNTSVAYYGMFPRVGVAYYDMQQSTSLAKSDLPRSQGFPLLRLDLALPLIPVCIVVSRILRQVSKAIYR